MTSRQILLASAATALLGFLPAAGARAAAIYTLDQSNGVIGAGPFGSVSVSLTDATHAQVTFTSNTAAGYYFLDGSSAAVNTNGTASLGSITGNALPGASCPTGGAACYTPAVNQNVSTFGVFSNAIDTTDGFTNRSSTISFVLTLSSGTWATDAAVLAANSDGYFAAAHIGQCNSAANCTDFISTGFAANNSGPQNTPAPEPTTLALLGAGLLGLAVARRQRR